MRLASFIRSHSGEIVAEWVDFASTLRPFTVGAADTETLRDAITDMLAVIADDLEAPESEGEKFTRARGRGDADEMHPSPAWEHGIERLQSGLDICELVAEYRSLREIVVRLYADSGEHDPTQLCADVLKFDESIDRAIAESLAAYSKRLDKLRNTLLAVLAHDLRSPLQAIAFTGEALSTLSNRKTAALVDRIKRGAERMTGLIEDFLTFLTPALGGAIPIEPEPMDLADAARSIVDEVSATLAPDRISLVHSGDTSGNWDRARIEQVLSNLLRNAADHGACDRPITVRVAGADGRVHVAVHNFGPPIPPQSIGAIFKPLIQLNISPESRRQHFGLGLYIANELVHRHGGTICVESSAEGGTTFSVDLPR
jgi:nitrogen-specific signal transduction histidine kinase